MRSVVGVTAAVHAGAYLAGAREPTLIGCALAAAAIASGTLLIIGFFTPASAAVVAAGGASILLPWHDAPSVFLDGAAAMLVVADATALILLGPGAFSLDARLFGRREIDIPHEPSLSP